MRLEFMSPLTHRRGAENAELRRVNTDDRISLRTFAYLCVLCASAVGRLPCRKVGRHRRVLFDDLMAYQQVMHEETPVRIKKSPILQQWFGGKRSVEISEDMIGLGRYGKTLTVLYDIHLPAGEEDDEEAALIESWTPRFKR